MKTERLPGGATVHYMGRSDPGRCTCGRPTLPGETGCRECMTYVAVYVARNALRGIVSWKRVEELARKLAAAPR